MAKSTLPRHVLHVSFAVLTAVNRGLWSYGMCGASLGTWFPNGALIFKSHVAHEECLCKCRQCAFLIWWEPLTRSRSIQLRILETRQFWIVFSTWHALHLGTTNIMEWK